jgi:hypothetical protein
VNSDFEKIAQAILQLCRDLQQSFGIYAWLLLGTLLLTMIFLGYCTMWRLLRQKVHRPRRRFLSQRRFATQPLARR